MSGSSHPFKIRVRRVSAACVALAEHCVEQLNVGAAHVPVREPAIGEGIKRDDLPCAWLQGSLHEAAKLLERLLC